MLDWIGQYSDPLMALGSIGTLLIWLIYLQLFFVQYRRHTTPALIISRGGGTSLHAHCLLSNMSGEAVHIQAIIATLRGSEGIANRSVTDRRDLALGEGDRAEYGSLSQRGPLPSGRMMDVGPFSALIRGVSDADWVPEKSALPPDIELPVIMEIEVVAFYGSEDSLVGAKRAFRLEGVDGAVQIRAETVHTEQLRRRRDRRRLERLLDE